jgi:hypothetical protein
MLLKRWTGQAELLLGAFYFWNSGSPDQRSHAGLLRTLLYEVLSKREGLILEIFREEWERKRDTNLDNLEVTASYGLLVDFSEPSKMSSSSPRTL